MEQTTHFNSGSLDPNQYQKLCLRTNTQAISKNLTFDVVEALLASLTSQIDEGTIVDELKKFIFYNKEIPYSISNIEIAPKNLEKVLEMEGGSNLLHAIVGLNSEIAELNLAFFNWLKGEPGAVTNLKEEMGDFLWYISVGLWGLETHLSTAMTANIEKLRKRYPQKFDFKEAVERNLDEEKATMEAIFTERKINPEE